MMTVPRYNMILIGFEVYVKRDRILAFFPYRKSAGIKKLIKDAIVEDKFTDASQGKGKKSVILMDTGHVIVTAIKPRYLVERLDKIREEEE